mgnify:CR=1 FL=1
MGKQTEDFYALLGIERSASPEEIKRAYRARARKVHPDVDSSPGAAERFSKLQQAYAVLSDPDRRQRYDRFGVAGDDAFASAATSLDPDDLGSMFDAFFGARGAPGASRAARRGRDIHRPVDVSFLMAVRGGTERLRLDTGGSERTIELKIPAGIIEGAKLRVRSAGERGRGEASAGDLIVTVHIGRHPIYRRVQGSPLDIELDLPLSGGEAALGASVDVPTPDGRKVSLRVPPGAAPGAVLRMRGHGIKQGPDKSGDLRAVIVVHPPDVAMLSDAEQEVLEGLTAKTTAVRDRFCG